MENEIWEDIDNYVGFYQVSNLGRVRSIDRIVKHWKYGVCLRKGKILKQLTNTFNYKFVILYKDGKTKHHRVNRLVAQAFIPNPENLPQVNHKDENKSNNRVENLEYCDAKYNANYGTRNERSSYNRINHPLKSKQVLQYTFDGDFVSEYPSMQEAQRQTGINQGCISACCNGKQKTAGGYKWAFKD